jgi:hypothetical protein
MLLNFKKERPMPFKVKIEYESCLNTFFKIEIAKLWLDQLRLKKTYKNLIK